MTCAHEKVEPHKVSEDLTVLKCIKCGRIVAHWQNIEESEKKVKGKPRKLSHKEKRLLS